MSHKQMVTKMPGKTILLSSIKPKSIFKIPLTCDYVDSDSDNSNSGDVLMMVGSMLMVVIIPIVVMVRA